MTKYIDLLREHQQKEAGDGKTISSDNIIEELSPTSETAPETQDNPYSIKSSSDQDEKNAEVVLLKEDEIAYKDEPLVLKHDDLLAEDEDLSVSTEHATKTTEIKMPPVTTADGFNISDWLFSLSQSLLSIFQSVQNEEKTQTSVIDNYIQQLLNQMISESGTLDALELEVSRNLTNICDTELSFNDLVQKSIMMMLYTIKVATQLKLEQKDIRQHTVAAMLHHIGMAMVPDNIRRKASKLTKDEVAIIREAPKLALDYLQTCDLDNDNDSLLLATAQANERYDGSGPSGLTGNEIAWSGRLIGLLSMFEALIHLRPYRPRLLPRDAIRELVNHHKKAFDPVLLKALIESISLYPVGTFIQLNTGEIGQVIAVHNKFPLRPIVHISMDKFGNSITERNIDLKQQPNLMIQKCMYEESIKNLA